MSRPKVRSLVALGARLRGRLAAVASEVAAGLLLPPAPQPAPIPVRVRPQRPLPRD